VVRKYQSVARKFSGPLQVGSRVAFVANFLMKRLSYTCEVVEYPGQKFVMKTAEGPFPMETTYTFAAVSANITGMTSKQGQASPCCRTVHTFHQPDDEIGQ